MNLPKKPNPSVHGCAAVCHRSLLAIAFASMIAVSPWVAAADSDAANAGDNHVTDQEALAIAALRALMAAPPERALPLLEKTLAGKQSERVKERALFVLGQVNDPAAEQLLIRYAQTSPSTALKQQAIRSLGIRGSAASRQALSGMFRDTDEDGKGQIIHALLVAGGKAELLALAKANGAGPHADAIINALAAMGASEELRALAGSGVRAQSLVQAYAISGDVDAMIELIAKTTDPGEQAEMVSKIGISQGLKARQALINYYQTSTSAEVREAALHGLMIQGDAEPLLALYRSTNNTQEKSRILRLLSTMDSDAALNAIDAALQGETP